MKKWFYTMILAAVPMLSLSVASCSDDKDLPDVDITLDVAQGVVDNGTIYVVQGDTIEISAIQVANKADANKGATVTNVNYYWDGLYYAPSMFSPFGMVFPTTDETVLGNHNIGVSCTVLAVDKTIANGALSYPVVVVKSKEDLPVATEGGEIQSKTSLSN